MFIQEYNIMENDYITREEIVKTNDIYHEIGKIYCQSLVKIKRIDYLEITKDLEQEIERLKEDNEYLNKVNIELSTEKNRLNNIINEIYTKANDTNITSLDLREYILNNLGVDKKWGKNT